MPNAFEDSGGKDIKISSKEKRKNPKNFDFHFLYIPL